MTRQSFHLVNCSFHLDTKSKSTPMSSTPPKKNSRRSSIEPEKLVFVAKDHLGGDECVDVNKAMTLGTALQAACERSGALLTRGR